MPQLFYLCGSYFLHNIFWELSLPCLSNLQYYFMWIFSIPSLYDSHFCFLGAVFLLCLTELLPPPPSTEWSKSPSAVFSTTYSAGPSSHLQTGGCLAWRLGKGFCFSAIYGHMIPVKQCSAEGSSSPRAGSRMDCSYVLCHLRISSQCPVIKSLETAVYTAKLPHCNHSWSSSYFKNSTFKEKDSPPK